MVIRLVELSAISKTMVYGTEDDDFNEVVPTLRTMECNKFDLKIIDGADHNFTGMVKEFISLADEI
jgi:alpha/beta superfamily hydrolase